MKRLQSCIHAIQPCDPTGTLSQKAQAHLDNLTKPQGSLGDIETIARRLFCIQGGNSPISADPARIYTVAGDHGVAEEGVSSSPQCVTRQMVLNFLNNGAAINVLCKNSNCDLLVVDAGVCGEDFEEHPRLIRHKVAQGTRNMCREAAMSVDECLEALLLGISLADKAHNDGYRIIGTGEMGIANTTPSTALYCAYLQQSPTKITGMGTGIAPEQIPHKIAVIQKALALHARVIANENVFDILAALGGLEIATIAGLILGSAKHRMPIVVDGFISSAAWLAAWKLCPTVEDYSFFSHASAETGQQCLFAHTKYKPLLNLGLRLGEGTGAALSLPLFSAAAAIYNEMASFSDAGVHPNSPNTIA